MIDTKEIAKHLNEYRKSGRNPVPTGVGIYPSQHKYNLRLLYNNRHDRIGLVLTNGEYIEATLLEMRRSDLLVTFVLPKYQTLGLTVDLSMIYNCKSELSVSGVHSNNLLNKFGIKGMTDYYQFGLELVKIGSFIKVLIPSISGGCLFSFNTESNALFPTPFINESYGIALDFDFDRRLLVL